MIGPRRETGSRINAAGAIERHAAGMSADSFIINSKTKVLPASHAIEMRYNALRRLHFSPPRLSRRLGLLAANAMI